MSKRKKFSHKNKPLPQVRSGTSAATALHFRLLGGVALVALAAFLAYLPALNGGFILDDDKLLTDNRLIKATDGLYRFWCTTEAQDYWPVSNSTLWLEWRLWEINPSGYHVTNLILHIAESLLIWVLLRKLSIPGAFLAAVIFAVHPVNVESVAWIASRKNLMAMFFFLFSILCYLKLDIASSSTQEHRYRTTSPLTSRPSPLAPGHHVSGRSPLWYLLCLAAFVLAMLSKGSVVILPVLLLLIVWWQREITIRDLVRMAPFFVVAMALGAVNVWFQDHGSGAVLRTANFVERLLGAGGGVGVYLYKALLPFDLAFVYPPWQIRMSDPLWWLPLVAALVVTIVLWQYKGRWSRPFLFAWGFFCVALAPVMGFTDVGYMRFSLVANRYQHIAIIGVIALVAAGWGVW